MKLNSKAYKKLKIRKYLKKSKIFFLLNSFDQNSYNWITTQQELKKMTFNYHKIFNRISRNEINNSIYRNLASTNNGITFFFTPNKKLKVLTKQILLTSSKSFLFDILAIKFNNKLYTLKQIKMIHSLNYYNNHLILYQFQLINLKFFKKLSK